MTTTREITRRWAPALLATALLSGGAAAPHIGTRASTAAAPIQAAPEADGAAAPNAAALQAGTAAAPIPEAPRVGTEAAACTRFVTPATASAGEWIPVLAYRHRDRKGPLELRFDEKPTSYRLLRYATAGSPEVTELFLTVSVPSGAARGHHEIQLYEPSKSPGGRPERIATSAVVLGP